jgi:hypothetical protein
MVCRAGTVDMVCDLSLYHANYFYSSLFMIPVKFILKPVSFKQAIPECDYRHNIHLHISAIIAMHLVQDSMFKEQAYSADQSSQLPTSVF